MISSVDDQNLVTLTFNEPVLFRSYDNFVTNMKTNINGPSSPYTYSFTIIDEQGLLVENQTFTEIQVSVHDIQASIQGGGKERIEIWWDDLSVIQDPSNNTLSEGKMIGFLNYYEYVPPDTEAAASNGGSSMRYTLISIFTINMGMKLIVSSSAALMWSLIHVLQLFRYILMMNINMPKLIGILMEYLVVVIGEVDELEEHTPDILNEYLLDRNDLIQNMTIYPRFKENGYDTPYLNDLHGKQFFSFAIIVFVFMPMIYFCRIMCRKVKFCYMKLTATWSGFFWNAPVRTFTELYVEIALGFFMHTLNVRFKTPSGIVAT